MRLFRGCTRDDATDVTIRLGVICVVALTAFSLGSMTKFSRWYTRETSAQRYEAMQSLRQVEAFNSDARASPTLMQMENDIKVMISTQYSYIPPSEDELNDCKTKRYTRTGGWCLTPDQIRARKKNPNRYLAQYLAEFFEGQSVADIGAGLGIYKQIIVEKGKARYVVAFDGAINVNEVSGGLVQFRDFAKPQDIGVYDWVYSVEVGEHIPVEFEAIFMENLSRAAQKGIILTWAHPGQAGDGHVNNRERGYITEKFAELGFSLDDQAREDMRDAAKDYFVNLYVFVRRSS